MIYLEQFTLMDEDATSANWSKILQGQTADENYPIGMFPLRLQSLDFDDITILYGGNGSGKTTLLNIIAETIDIQREEKYLRTRMFDFFVNHCSFELTKSRIINPDFSPIHRIPHKSKFIASDDIFKHILSVREGNRRIKNDKNAEEGHYYTLRDTPYRDYWEGGVRLDMDDHEGVDKFRQYVEERSKTKRQFVKSRAGTMERQFSNGENALMYFDKQIEKDALYLLDEPENSMSPQFQLELKTLIEDSVRFNKCQFIIATHSPFILALKNAKIYNLDASPVTVEPWQKLNNMMVYYDFFMAHKEGFEQG